MFNASFARRSHSIRITSPGSRSRSETALRAAVRPCIERMEGRRLFSAGELDPTFGTDGVVKADFLTPIPGTDAARAVVLTQADGKMLVAGSTQEAFANNGNFALARYLS